MRFRKSRELEGREVRYAVVGLGYIAQVAVLPAFKHARENSRLTALISHDDDKLRKLGHDYGVEELFTYEEYDMALESGLFDAVYIALPNSMHCDFTVRAAEAGIHVLCEKPMADTPAECERMIAAARENDVRLMIAYRLHFEEANLEAIKIVQSGQIGEPRLFQSTFTMSVKDGDIRVRRDLGGGPLQDIGIYCINAARYLFQEEPFETYASATTYRDPRFREVPEMVSAVLRFPNEKLASFTCSFNGGDVSSYRVVGTKGDLLVEPAYEHAEGLAHRLTVGGKHHGRSFRKRDQFAPELVHFSECVLTGREPGPGGMEGLADVRIIESITESYRLDQPIALEPSRSLYKPSPSQQLHKRATSKPRLFHATSPSKDQ